MNGPFSAVSINPDATQINQSMRRSGIDENTQRSMVYRSQLDEICLFVHSENSFTFRDGKADKVKNRQKRMDLGGAPHAEHHVPARVPATKRNRGGPMNASRRMCPLRKKTNCRFNVTL